MVPRELIGLLGATIFVATAAVVSASAAPSIDLDLTATGGASDYELFADSDDRNDDLIDSSRGDVSEKKIKSSVREVRCYCNQPHCVAQGYMCRGKGCFTEIPIPSITLKRLQIQQFAYSRPEHAAYSGCLEQNFAESSCPQGKLCCEQDLCNHVDSPAMRARLNKTLQVLLGEHHNYLQGSTQPTGQQVQAPSDNWFRTATIAVPICGFIVLLILASLAIRLLQPLPTQNDKLSGLRMMPEAAPPLLGHPQKMHHHLHHHHQIV